MLAIHDPIIHQTSDRLKTTCMGLGLVRLLQDAKRFDEARTTLYALEAGFQGVAEESVSGSASCSSTSPTRTDDAHLATQPSSIV